MLLLGVTHAAQHWTLDLSSQPANQPSSAVSTAGAQVCRGRDDGDVIDVAIVIYGRQRGQSIWGHAAVRFLACVDQTLTDEEIEAYRFSRRTMDALTAREPELIGSSPTSSLRKNRGRLYIRRTQDPSDGGSYARQIGRNRDIYEIWLQPDPSAAKKQRAALLTLVNEQREALRTGQTLKQGSYFALGRNCMVPIRWVQESLLITAKPEVRQTLFPMRLLRQLEHQDGLSFVLHPSSNTLRHTLEQVPSRDALASALPIKVERSGSLFRKHLEPVDRYWASHIAQRWDQPMSPALRPSNHVPTTIERMD